MVTQTQQTSLMNGLLQESIPSFFSQPTLNTLAVGTPITVVDGVLKGYPAPTISYSLTINNVPKPWGYTPLAGDANGSVSVYPLATNTQGSTAGTTLMGTIPVPNVVPGVPGTPTLSSITSTSETVNWTPPTTGGLPTLYTVNYRVNGSSSWTQAGTTTSLSYAVTSLASSTYYDFQVIASNGVGAGLPSTTVSGSTTSAGAIYWPTTYAGQNVPPDSSYTTMRIYNDRMQVGSPFYKSDYSALLPASSVDANGLPTTAFLFKACEGNAGQLAFDPSVTGTWYIIYSASVKRNITFLNNNSTISSHTYSAGVGKVQFSYVAGGSALAVVFDGGVTAIQCYDPTTSATAIAGSTVQQFNAQYLRTFNPYNYGRFMDMSGVNGDYMDTTGVTYAPYQWKSSVEFADRSTPTNFHLNSIKGNAGMPLEWQIGLLTAVNKNGWFNISELASDDCITQFATFVATNMPVSLWSAFELGNERWNTGGGFYCYRKAGWAGAVETNAAQPAKTYLPAAITSFSSDGSTATIVFASNHGASTGLPISMIGLASGYTGFAPTGTLTVVSTTVLTYPCTQASTGGTVPASTVLNSWGWAALPQSEWTVQQYNLCALSFSSDGVAPGSSWPTATSTMTVVYNKPHGATTGQSPKLIGFNSGFTTYQPVAGATLTVVDSLTITYPCTAAATTNPVPALTVLPYAGILVLNGTDQLVSYLTSVYDISQWWHIRRAFQMALLVKNAFIAAGRTVADCKPVFAFRAGTQYYYGARGYDSFIAGIFSGATLGSRFTAIAIGGYYGCNQQVIQSGFGFTKAASDPSLTTEAAIDTCVNQMVSAAIGAYAYTAICAWAKASGMEVWGYEIGMDVTTASGESTATRNAKDAYQADYTNYGASIEAQSKNWIRNLQLLGFTHYGWYQCGAGAYPGYGGFNLGQTPNEIDYTTALSGQSPKFRGIVDSQSPPTVRNTYHAFPCTLSGWDCVGNEAVVTTGGVWPSLSGLNLPYTGTLSYQGPLSNGQTWTVWSETTQTVTVTLTGNYTSGPAQTLVVTPLGGTPANISVGAAPISNALLGTCQIQLAPGMNYVFVSSASHATTTFIQSVQFS
jgi:Fibronectin type III domain